MKENTAIKKVFISYAREDQTQAEKIYQYLSDADFDPWMDVHDIVSGNNWLKSITRAIKQSDYFLAVLSHNSVNKPGVLQEELDIALEICKKIPDPEIFLIPVRLEDCRMPERISQYQWVNLFAEDGWVRLLRALHQKRQKPRKWDWRLVVLIFGLLFAAGFITLKAAFQPVETDPALYENVCKSSEVPLKVGFAKPEDCSQVDWDTLSGMWDIDSVQLTPLDQVISSSQQAQALTGYDLVIWGSCKRESTLQFELISSRKPDEIYEPTNLQVTGKLTELGNIGKALISYQRGEYADAVRQFENSELASTSPAFAMLRANSLMFNGNYEDAISLLENIVLIQAPQWGAAYNNLGIALFNNDLLKGKPGFIPSGLAQFDQAVKYAGVQNEDQALLLAYTNKSDLLRRAGNWEDAEKACQAALSSYAQSSTPYVCLALFKISRFAGSSDATPFKEIQDDLDNAKRFDRLPAKFYYLQAGLYRMQKQKQKALTDYERFLEVMHDRACLEVDWKYIKEAAGYITELQH